jgi:ABC-2 type transport system ATP-binding protein
MATTETIAPPPSNQREELSGHAPIELSGLTHDYGSRLALDGLTFDVRPAEIFGLLGPNGSGKTTLFRILATLMIPTVGHARIAGFDVAKEPNRVRQQTGIVFQATSLDVKLTVAENLMHQGHLYGLRGANLQARAKEVLSRVGLTDRAKDMVETLSGGQKRRIELAKGLIHSPSVLLLDEPSTGLDPGARLDLWHYLRILRDEQGVTVLVTTHLMEEAEHCDRLAFLSAEIGGDVVQFETVSPEAAAALGARITERFAIAPTIVGNAVRVEREQGHRFLTEVVESFPGAIESVSVSKPSLEDVFIQRTGHRFWLDKNQEQS